MLSHRGRALRTNLQQPLSESDDSDDSWSSDSEQINSSIKISDKEERDWQLTRPYLWQQNEYILKYSLMTDCTFKVGKEPDIKVFECHKLLLSKTSPVFEAMLYGPLAEKQAIHIPDIEPDIFSLLLKYIYTSKLAEMTNYDSALSLCYAAKKYMLQRVVTMCVKYLWNDITPATACSGYEFAKLMEVPELAAKCLKVIHEKTSDVVADKNFLEIDHETLVTILMQDNLNVESEEQLISAATTWAKAEAARKELPTDSSSLRKILGTAFKHLRFLSLSLMQFAAGPMKSDLLTSDEKIAIMSCIESSSIATLIESSISKIKTKRTNELANQQQHAVQGRITVKVINQQQHAVQGRNTFNITLTHGARIESIIGFTFSNNVHIKGIYISTPHLRNNYVQMMQYVRSCQQIGSLILHQGNIKIYLQKSCNRLMEKVQIKEIENNTRIIFDKSIPIIPNKHYKFHVHFKHTIQNNSVQQTTDNVSSASQYSQWFSLPISGSVYTIYYCC